MNLVPYAVPVFLFLIVVEIFYGKWRGDSSYRTLDAVNSLSLGLLSTVTKLVFLNIGLIFFSAIEQDYALFTLDVNSIMDWVVGFFIYDFFYYWFHRVSHERQLFWGSHVVHHSSEDYNLSTALRQTSTGFLSAWVFFVPCFILGMPVYMYVAVASGHLIYQFWIHTRHIPKLGFLEKVFMTPSAHRVHHAQNPRFIDKNYGGTFIVWDQMFGTYQEEDEDVIYGLRTPLLSWNPLWANVHIFVSMFNDARRAESRWDKVKMLFSRTGWRPADVAEKFPVSKTDLSNIKKYGREISSFTSYLIAAQYVLLTVVHVYAMSQAANMPYAIMLGLVILQAATVIVLGAVADGKANSVALEFSRCILLSVGLLMAFNVSLISVSVFSVFSSYIVFSGCLMFFSIRSSLTNTAVDVKSEV